MWKLNRAIGCVLSKSHIQFVQVILPRMNSVSGSVELSYTLTQFYSVEMSPIPFDHTYFPHICQQFVKRCLVHREKQVFKTDLCIMASIIVADSIIDVYKVFSL